MIDLVLLPGTLCDGRLFAAQTDALAEVARVHIGNLTRSSSIAGMAAEVLSAAPSRFALAGLSLGGIVAMEIMRQAPERVERLALLDTTHRLPRPDQVARWEMFDQLTRRGEFDAITPQYLIDGLLHRHTPDAVELVVDMARKVGPEAFLRQNAAQPTRSDNRGVLASITCPTLVLCGAEDQICPVEVHVELAQLIPGSHLVVVPNAGHLSPLDAPEAVTQALAGWLGAELEPSPAMTCPNQHG